MRTTAEAGQPHGGWRFWIDRGGTFTDLVGRAPDGSLVVRKILSERGQPSRPPADDGAGAVVNRSADPAVAAMRQVLGLAPGAPIPPGLIEEVRLGTTVATNALLERRLEPALLLVNRGYADLPLIGEQHRPEIFALRIERPPPLPHRVLEVPGRLAADGTELEPFVHDPLLEEQLRAALQAGLRSCAVALLHAVSQPAHELALGAWLEELGFTPVLLSHRVGGLPRLVPRLQTTLAEAAVRPVLARYLDQVQQALGPATRLRVMTSAGVLQPPEALLAKDTCLSGPAGGLVGAVAVAQAAGLGGRPILGFDMGGTSTDVFHLEGAAGDAERSPETLVAGLRLQALSLPIHTVAAGGGSVLALEGGRLQVGPASAGALPGPACYRQGGPLTITDANLLLGRLPPQGLPAVFGPGGDQGADGAVVRRGFEALVAELNGAVGADQGAELQGTGAASPGSAASAAAPAGGSSPPARFTPESLAHGARSIAIERMAEAIRRISIQRGHAIGEAVLVSYGGAGGQHACALAERLGVRRVLLHPLAGVLSAYGIGLSCQQALRSEAVQRPLAPAQLPELIARREALLQEADMALQAAGDGVGDRSAARVVLELRLQGGERGLELPWADGEGVEALRQAFEHRHQERFGYVVAGEELVVERLQVMLPALAPVGLAPQGLAEVAGASGNDGATAALPAPQWLPLCLPVGCAGAAVAGQRPDSPAAAPQAAPEAAGGLPQPAASDRGDGAGGSAGDRRGDPPGDGLQWQQVPCWRREVLRPGQRLRGPAVLLEDTGTTVVEPGWGGRVLAGGALLLEPLRPLGKGLAASTEPSTEAPNQASTEALAEAAVPGAAGDRAGSPGVAPPPSHPLPRSSGSVAAVPCGEVPLQEPPPLDQPRSGPSAVASPGLDPVLLELYNHRFSAIAEQMGVRLQQSSRSVNIRERLDFSCALFDAAGRLVANAPHIPVHLGSMGESVVALLAAIERGEQRPLQPGDAIASNDPYAGGTHLPDITVMSPVFAPEAVAATPSPLFFVACRGHHADVGGITPGSMPPFSRTIHEEGLRLANVPLIQAGGFDAQAWRQRLAALDPPVRDPERLLADLQAQVAANRLGEQELHRLIRQRGLAEVLGGMEAVQRNAAAAVRSLIPRLHAGRHAVELDNGARILVAVEPDPARGRLRLDFSGTSPQQAGNLNAPLAITKAVVLYVLRVLVARPIPLNAGCFEPVELIVPAGCLLRPSPPAAVVGGNVETSQAVANALFAAFGVLAAGQGTMNNLSFGNDRCQYYETVAGGCGAGRLGEGEGDGFRGADALQSHMTNSRLTDPEILEARFPVRLESFGLRRGSGGAGHWRGGDGVVRLLRATEPITLAILSGSRRVPPFGLAGGLPGACGRNRLLRADGSEQELGGAAQVVLLPGDGFLLETPGGGGWGEEEPR